MRSTIMIENLKKVYYKNGVIEKDVAPFFLLMLLYNDDEKQFKKDNPARIELLNNTLNGIDDIRFIFRTKSYFMVFHYSKLNSSFYLDFCKEVLSVIIDKKWRKDVVLKAVYTISESYLTNIVINKTTGLFGTGLFGTSKTSDFKKVLIEHLASLDSKYNRYLVDDII